MLQPSTICKRHHLNLGNYKEEAEKKCSLTSRKSPKLSLLLNRKTTKVTFNINAQSNVINIECEILDRRIVVIT